MSGFTIRRTFKRFGYFNSLNVHVDGVRVGELRAGETRAFEVSEGLHHVHVSMDWCRSPAVAVAVPQTGGPTFDAGITFGLWSFMLCPLGILLWSQQFFTLEPRRVSGTAR